VTYQFRHMLGDAVAIADSGPFFIPDIYENDLGPAPNFDALAAQPSIVGCILKATQGVSYAPAWFTQNWPRVRDAGGSRYGDSWFRGCYHFGTPAASGSDQADFLLAAVDRAGGWSDGDMPPAWDLEGSAWSSAQQILDISSQFAARIKSRLGKTPILYTGATWRQFGITDRAGFDRMWSSHLNLMEPFGWPDSSYALYQYAGDGKLYNPATAMFGYPTTIPGWGGTDMSVVMSGGVAAADISSVKSVLTGKSSIVAPLLIGAALFAVALALSRYRSGERLL
jgi:hypothetical protein